MDLVESNLEYGIRHTYFKIKSIYKQHDIENQCELNAQLLKLVTIDFIDLETQQPILFEEKYLDYLDSIFFDKMKQ